MPELPEAAELLYSAEAVDQGVTALVAQLQPVIAQDDCILLGILNGGLYPLMRIARELQGDFLLDYCHASRYAGAQEGGELQWRCRPTLPLTGHTVIVVDDIWDRGDTLAAVAAYCREAGATQVYTAVLVSKNRERPAAAVAPDFSAGLAVPDRYVFGCGMDLEHRWRHLDAIYALPETSAT